MSEFVQEEELEQETVEFEIDDVEKAEWALDKIRDHKAEINKWTQYFEAEKRRVCMKHENAIIKLIGKLKGFFILMYEGGFTRALKTMDAYNLPTGRLAMKHPGPKFVRDDDVIIEWLRKNAPQFIKTTETVDWDGMKKAFSFVGTRMAKVDDETGEIEYIPGVDVIQPEDEFEVKEK